jgi:hypothetical protein
VSLAADEADLPGVETQPRSVELAGDALLGLLDGDFDDYPVRYARLVQEAGSTEANDLRGSRFASSGAVGSEAPR